MNRCKFSLGLPLFGSFWAPLATIGDTSRKDTPPIVSKPQPVCPVTVIAQKLIKWPNFGSWSFLNHFGPFWALRGQNLWHTPHRHTPNSAKTSARMSCNLFHAVPTVLDHQSAPARALKPTSIIGHKKGHFQIFGPPEEVERGEIFEKSF